MTTVCLIELANRSRLLDEHGPRVEKLLTAEFERRIKSWMRDSDQGLLIHSDRYFAILKGVQHLAQIKLAMHKLFAYFETPVEWLGVSITLSVIAGFVIVVDATASRDALIKKAGLALCAAREQGTRYSIYQDGQNLDEVDTSTLLKQLDAAVEQGEFRLYYQPKIHPGYKNIVGAEALIRWHRSDKTIVFPDAFIPVAEKHDVIRPITWWVVKAAVARAAQWSSGIGVCVNVPPNLLLDDELQTVISDALSLYAVSPKRLTIEVTESVMVSSQEKMFAALAQLRQTGVRVSIDDFGTGYSSMVYFRDLPADELKLDKSFVMAMTTSKRDAAIVRSVIDLAHNFGLRVVAEGVETQEIVDVLTKLKCDVLQGYFFDKPLPLEEFERRYCR